MGRKSDLGRFAAAHHGAPVTTARLLTFLAVGFVLGGGGGWIFMGTMHAFLEIGASSHHGQEQIVAKTAGEVQQQQQQQQVNGAGQQQQQQQQTIGAGQQQQTATTQQAAAGAGSSGGGWPTTGDTVHIVYTSNGSPYTNYQNLIMYGTFKLAQRQPGGEKMVGFTRILHRTTDDALSPLIPTFRADPLHPECDNWCEYPVADRPNAVRQFLDAAKKDPSMIKAPLLYVIETDFVVIKPIVAPRAESSAKSIAFSYGYIQPTYPTIEGVMRKLYPASEGPLSNIPPTGCSPTLMRVEEWMRVTPRWEAITAQIEADEEAKKALDWVREMYAFSVAVALEHVQLDVQLPPESVTMIQPPADHKLGKAHLMHYTWGPQFKKGDTLVWEFDKRKYTEPKHEKELPKLPLPPPFEEGWKLQDGIPVTRDLYDTLVLMITTMNAGIDVTREELHWGQ